MTHCNRGPHVLLVPEVVPRSVAVPMTLLKDPRSSGVSVPLAGWSQLCVREAGEPSLQRVDLREVSSDVVVTTSLAARQKEPPSRVGLARPGATQVDDGGQILLLRERGAGHPLALQRLRDATIQERGGQLDGVTGHHPRVEAVEPA